MLSLHEREREREGLLLASDKRCCLASKPTLSLCKRLQKYPRSHIVKLIKEQKSKCILDKIEKREQNGSGNDEFEAKYGPFIDRDETTGEKKFKATNYFLEQIKKKLNR